MTKNSVLYGKLISRQQQTSSIENEITHLKEKIARQERALQRFVEFKQKYKHLIEMQMNAQVDDDIRESIPELNLGIDLKEFDNFKPVDQEMEGQSPEYTKHQNNPPEPHIFEEIVDLRSDPESEPMEESASDPEREFGAEFDFL